MKTKRTWVLTVSMALLIGACQESPDPGDSMRETGQGAAAPTNRIEVAGAIAANLGITWAAARRGRLEHRISVPGELVVPPDREWTIRGPLPGTVTTVAALWSSVDEGDVIAEIVSSELADIQAKLYGAVEQAEEARIAHRLAKAESGPHREYADALVRAAKDALQAEVTAAALVENGLEVAQEAKVRVQGIRGLKGSVALTEATLLDARRVALELDRSAADAANALRDARVASRELHLKAARARASAAESEGRLRLIATRVAAAEAAYAQLVGSLAAASGMTEKELDAEENGVPYWALMRSISLRAPSRGIIVTIHVASRTRVDRDAPLVVIQDPSVLMFRGMLPEADVALLPPDAKLAVRIPGVDETFAAYSATLRPLVDAATRSLVVEARLENGAGTLRAGSSATGELVVSVSPSEEVLIPSDCIVRDGLESVVFRRDPAKLNEVIRVPVTLGSRSAGWTEVIAGVGAKDQIVKDGAHQLKETGLGRAEAGGHFHADGTWHGEH